MSEATTKNDMAEESIDKEQYEAWEAQYEAWEAQCQDAQVKIGDIGVGDELLCMLGHVRVMAIAPLAHCTRYLVKTVLSNGCLAEEEQSFLANPSDLLDQVDDIIWVKRGGQTIYQKPAVVDNPSKFYGMGQPSHLACVLPESWYLAHGVAKCGGWIKVDEIPIEWKDGRVLLGYDDSAFDADGYHGLYPVLFAEPPGPRKEARWVAADKYKERCYPQWVRPMIELPEGRKSNL